MKNQLVQVDKVTKKFGDLVVLNDISFSVQEGEMLAIIGPNGSGKSTLAKILLGLVKPTKGKVHMHGLQATTDIGYVPQRFSFDRTVPITVREFLELQICRHTESDNAKDIEEALEEVGVSSLEHALLGTLSGGQLQRVLVARALLHESNLLVLDEPNSHIDRKGEQAMYELLKKINKDRNVTIIVVSHELDFVKKYADTVLCVNCSMVCHGDPKKTITKKAMNHLYACTTC